MKYSHKNSVTAASMVFSVSRSTIYRWRTAYAEHGREGLRPKSTAPHNPRTVLTDEIQHRLLKRLLKKDLLLEEVDRRVAKYMREYDLKKRYREANLAGKSSYERQRANALFEIEWSKIRKHFLEKD